MKSRWVNRLLIASIVIAISGIIISYAGYKKRRVSEKWVIHTHLVIKNAYQILSSTMDAEASQRSFLLTGDPNYLSPYNTSVNQIQTLVDSLRTLTLDNPPQTKLIDEKIKPLSDIKLNEWKNTLNISDNENREKAILFLTA